MIPVGPRATARRPNGLTPVNAMHPGIRTHYVELSPSARGELSLATRIDDAGHHIGAYGSRHDHAEQRVLDRAEHLVCDLRSVGQCWPAQNPLDP